jgi:hypothetical protein
MPTQLEAWLGEFPRDEAEARIAHLERELVRWRNALAMHDALTGRNGTVEVKEGEIPTKPQAIQMILRENQNQPMAPGQIRKTMIDKGWLPADRAYQKRFYATMSRLNGEGRILRLQDGRYVLPPDLLEGAVA